MWHPADLASHLVFDGDADFDERILPGLVAIPFFRAPTEEEVARSFAAYRSPPEAGSGVSNTSELIEVWRTVAEPTRANLTGVHAGIYRRFGRLPSTVTGLSFLLTLRAVLDAGVHFRATLSTPIRQSLEEDFPWLQHRHEHIPAGPFPDFKFPPGFAAFLESSPTLDDARARWQLIAALNEVQQTVYSHFLSVHFGLPELVLHAERERQLAENYFAHWSPRATERLWRQCLTILDALNARVFQLTSKQQGPLLLASSLFGVLFRRHEWPTFVSALGTPQHLLPPPTV